MKKTFLLLALTLSGLFACSEQKQVDKCEAIIDDSSEIVHKEKTLMSSILTISDVIPLETNDSSLLGSIEKVTRRGNFIYIKSGNSPLMMFDKEGRFRNCIGKIGSGPEEYPLLSDFDIKNENIYILTANKIQVYDCTGKWTKEIPIGVNASGIRLTGDKILLSVLNDEKVIHLLDENGKFIESQLKNNSGLGLQRNISFVKYGHCYLFPMGRSNELFAYDTTGNGTFNRMSYLASEQLTSEQESAMKENNRDYQKELDSRGFFDGILADNTHAIVPFIKKGNITVWMKNIQTSQVMAYDLSALENDLTYLSASSFFYDNTESDSAFLTYVMPYKLKERLKEVPEEKRNQYFERLDKIVETSSEDGNPIIIEYKIKAL